LIPTLLHVFPTFAVGGAQSRMAAVANHVGAAARHIVVALDGRLDAREKLDASLDVAYPDPGALGGRFAEFRRARRFLAGVKADRLITSNWGAMDWAAAGRLTRLAHVHTEDGFGPEEQDGQLSRRVWARRLLLRRSEVVVPSRVLQHLAAEVWRLPASRLRYIPNGVDLARFAGAAPAPLAPGDGPVIGTIAALRPEKNLARLLRAFATARADFGPARLIVVGDGGSRGELEALASTLGIRDAVHFAGHSTTPEAWLAACDIFALSSDTEQMPLSLLEAMAAGLPAIATDVGDVRAMLSQQNAGFVVRRDDAAFAAALAALLRDAQGRRRIGAANRDRAAAVFDQAAMFTAWRRIWLGETAAQRVVS
jgi:glycosyltransferase involved in cell wall biosynthesis